MGKANQEANGPYYGMDYWLVGTYWKSAVVTRTFTYEKKNRNFLLGKIHFESKVMEDRRCHKDLHLREEEQELPSWKDPLREQGYGRSPLSQGPSPTRRRTGTSFLERSTSRARLWLMERGSTRPSWIPGPPPTPWSGSTSLSGPSTQPQETSKKASHTMHLPSGKDLTIDLAWP